MRLQSPQSIHVLTHVIPHSMQNPGEAYQAFQVKWYMYFVSVRYVLSECCCVWIPHLRAESKGSELCISSKMTHVFRQCALRLAWMLLCIDSASSCGMTWQGSCQNVGDYVFCISLCVYLCLCVCNLPSLSTSTPTSFRIQCGIQGKRIKHFK